MDKNKKLLVFCNPIVDTVCQVDDAILKKHKLEKGKTLVLNDEQVKRVTKDLTVSTYSCGGSAMNVARWIGFLGHPVSVIGQLGDDEKAEKINRELENCNIDNKFIVQEGAVTTSVCVCVTPDAQRTMFCIYGASKNKFCKPIDYSVLRGYAAVLFEGYQFEFQEVVNDLEPIIEKSYEMGKKNIFVISNIFSVPNYSETLNRIIGKFKIITGTKDEFSILFGIQNLEELLTFLENSEYELCAVTMGEEGCYLIYQGKRIFVPAPEVNEVIDTTGAGDSFTAGLIYGYLNDYSIDDCGKLANFCAGKTISQLGVVMDPEIKKEFEEYISKISPIHF